MVDKKYKKGKSLGEEHGIYCEGLVIRDVLRQLQEKGILKDPIDIGREYRDNIAKDKGYKDYNEFLRVCHWNNGDNIPMSENEDCAQYLGIYISERLLSKIYDNVIRMPYGNPGFDFICNKGFRIQVKTRCLSDGNRKWQFPIKYNDNTDYFMLVAVDNRIALNMMHLWLIKKDDIIRGEEFYKRDTISITNKPIYLLEFQVYEQIDNLEKLKECCEELKSHRKY